MIEKTIGLFHDEQLKKFGKRLRQIRKQRNLTQLDLEVETGIYEAEISKMENGMQNVEFFTLSKLAFAFKIEILELFKFEHLPPEDN
jgi:transcriptional regulator with XRE-family HTH domain